MNKHLVISAVLALAGGMANAAPDHGEQVYRRVVLGDTSVTLDTSNRVATPALGSYAAYLRYVGLSAEAAAAAAARIGETPVSLSAQQARTADNGEAAYRRYVLGRG